MPPLVPSADGAEAHEPRLELVPDHFEEALQRCRRQSGRPLRGTRGRIRGRTCRRRRRRRQHRDLAASDPSRRRRGVQGPVHGRLRPAVRRALARGVPPTDAPPSRRQAGDEPRTAPRIPYTGRPVPPPSRMGARPSLPAPRTPRPPHRGHTRTVLEVLQFDRARNEAIVIAGFGSPRRLVPQRAIRPERRRRDRTEALPGNRTNPGTRTPRSKSSPSTNAATATPHRSCAG